MVSYSFEHSFELLYPDPGFGGSAKHSQNCHIFWFYPENTLLDTVEQNIGNFTDFFFKIGVGRAPPAPPSD
jgi:hypothetical protein